MGQAAQSPIDHSEGPKTSISCQHLVQTPLGATELMLPCSHRSWLPGTLQLSKTYFCSPSPFCPNLSHSSCVLAIFDIRGLFAHGQKGLVNLYSSFKTQLKCQMQIVFPDGACSLFRQSRPSCSIGSSVLCLPIYPFPQWQWKLLEGNTDYFSSLYLNAQHREQSPAGNKRLSR